MKTLRDMIIGNKISKISPVEDYVQVFFVDGGILNLYNDATFSHQYQQYSNEIVKKFIINKKLMCIKTGDKEITMSMREEDYYTPEAFDFYSKDDDVCIVG